MKEGAISIRVRLAGAWTSLMFCYIYADYFALFAPGKVAEMNRGIIAPLGRASDPIMIFVSAMMALPSLMIFLSLVLPHSTARWLNLAVAAVYAAIIAMIMRDSAVLLFFGVIEIGLTLAIAALAWRWRTVRA